MNMALRTLIAGEESRQRALKAARTDAKAMALTDGLHWKQIVRLAKDMGATTVKTLSEAREWLRSNA